MAENLKTRISLEGGEAIKSQLDAIGEAGKKAFSDLRGAAESSDVVGKVSKGFDTAKVKVAELGASFKDVGVAAKQFGSELSTQFDRAVNALGLVGALSVTGFAALVLGSAKSIDNQVKLAETLGITTKELKGLGFAAQQAGVDSDQFESALTKLAKAIEKTNQSGRDYQKQLGDIQLASQRAFEDSLTAGKKTNPFLERMKTERRAFEDLNRAHALSATGLEKLNIATKNLDGTDRNVHDVMLDLADAFKTLPPGANKAAIALDILGKGNARLVPFLNQGRAAILELRKEAERIAPSLGNAAKEQATALTIAFENFQKAFGSSKNAALAPFFPILTDLISAFTEKIVAARGDVVAFANDVASKVAPVIADIAALLQGRDQDVNNTFLIRARDAAVELGVALKKAVTEIILPALNLLLEGLDRIAKAINAVFGTEFSGKEIVIAVVIAKVLGLLPLFIAGLNLARVAVLRLFTTLGLPLIGAFALGFGAVTLATKGPTAALEKLKEIWGALWGGESGDAPKKAADEIRAAAGELDGLGAHATKAAADLDKIRKTTITVGKDGKFSIFPSVAEQTAEAQAIIAAAQAAADSAVTIFQNTGLQIGGSFSEGFNQIAEGAVIVSDRIGVAFTAFPQQALDAMNQVTDIFTNANDRIEQSFQQLDEQFSNTFDSIVNDARDAGNAIDDALSGVGGGGGGGEGFARGGFVRGPGTSTSDSVPIRVSKGEYVVRAKAVDHYGVGLLHLINTLRARIPGFNMGGLVQSLGGLMPPRTHYATGGLVGGNLRAVTVNLLDGSAVKLFGVQNEIDNLTRYALARQTHSAGRKASYWGR